MESTVLFMQFVVVILLSCANPCCSNDRDTANIPCCGKSVMVAITVLFNIFSITGQTAQLMSPGNDNLPPEQYHCICNYII